MFSREIFFLSNISFQYFSHFYTDSSIFQSANNIQKIINISKLSKSFKLYFCSFESLCFVYVVWIKSSIVSACRYERFFVLLLLISIIYPRPRGEAPRGGDIISSAVGAPEIALYLVKIFPFCCHFRISMNGYPVYFLSGNPSLFHLKYHISHIHSGFPV